MHTAIHTPNLRPCLPPPTILTQEVQRQHQSPQHLHPTPALTEAIASYYNQSTTDFTTPKHVIAGVHQTSLLFLLHLACKTFNECASSKQQRVQLQQHHCTTVVTTIRQKTHFKPSKPSKPQPMLDIHVLPLTFPNTCSNNQLATTLPHPCILVAEMPALFTNSIWNGAFAVFPHLARSTEQTVYTALLNIVKELQNELGALPTTAVQRGMQLACSPMVLAYALRCHTLVTGINQRIATVLQENANANGSSCTIIPLSATYPVSEIAVTIRYDEATHAETLVFMLEQVFPTTNHTSASNTDTRPTTLPTPHWTHHTNDVLLRWRPKGDLSKAIHALPNVDEVVDGVEAEWVATEAFVKEWVGEVWMGVGEVV